MPLQFQPAEEPAPLRTGVSEPLAAFPAAETANAARYTPDQAQRLLAEAARLQTHHRKTLSQSEIEGIAQEVGTDPEFVRRAIEQAGAIAKPTQPRYKRLSVPRLQRLPFRAVARTAILPICYACPLIPVTSWKPESGFANWFLLLYTVLPPLLAFFTGFLQRRIRLSATSGAFWGLGILFALALPNAIKLYQNLDNTGSVDMLQLLSETGMVLGLFLLYGAAFGIAGALARRGVEKGLKWYRKSRSHKSRANDVVLGTM